MGGIRYYSDALPMRLLRGYDKADNTFRIKKETDRYLPIA